MNTYNCFKQHSYNQWFSLTLGVPIKIKDVGTDKKMWQGFDIHDPTTYNSQPMAGWQNGLCSGLQIRLCRFDSDPGLHI